MARMIDRFGEASLDRTDDVVAQLRPFARPLATDRDLDPLMERIGDARYVLLGEASHGTSDFYTWRRRLSQRLVREKGFSFIAVEGDWPDCHRVDRYVKHRPDAGSDAYGVLHAFDRWPTQGDGIYGAAIPAVNTSSKYGFDHDAILRRAAIPRRLYGTRESIVSANFRITDRLSCAV